MLRWPQTSIIPWKITSSPIWVTIVLQLNCLICSIETEHRVDRIPYCNHHGPYWLKTKGFTKLYDLQPKDLPGGNPTIPKAKNLLNLDKLCHMKKADSNLYEFF